MSAVRRLRSRLAVKIYLVGLLQFSLVAAGLVLVAREGRRAEPSIQMLHVVAASIAASADDLAATSAAVANAETLLSTHLAVFDEQNHLVAGTPFDGPPPPMFARPPRGRGGPWEDAPNGRPPGPPELEPPDLGPPPPGEPPHTPPLFPFLSGHQPHHGGPPIPIHLRDGRTWRLAITASDPIPSFMRGVGLPVVLVLLVVGVSAWLTARSLARPLATLSAAARAFGAGDVHARASLTRSDELGEVSTAFDEMAERVTQALRAEKELLANVSHELRTPLQRIQIAIDLATEGDAATARESLDEIADDLAELTRIVEDVLSAARLSLQNGGGGQSPLPPVHLAPVELRALLERSVTRFRSTHPSRALDVDVATDLPIVEVDAVLLRRAVDNLLDNAHKYTDDPAAVVRLAGRTEPGHVVLEVEDHGVGIGHDDLPRLFEPFFRADRSRTRGTGGLGLGLLLARRIVEAHGGTLAVFSKAGRGTTARIELPCGGSPATS